MAVTEITDRISGLKSNFAALASSRDHQSTSGSTVSSSMNTTGEKKAGYIYFDLCFWPEANPFDIENFPENARRLLGTSYPHI